MPRSSKAAQRDNAFWTRIFVWMGKDMKAMAVVGRAGVYEAIGAGLVCGNGRSFCPRDRAAHRRLTTNAHAISQYCHATRARTFDGGPGYCGRTRLSAPSPVHNPSRPAPYSGASFCPPHRSGSALVVPLVTHYLLSVTTVSPFFGFVLALVIPGALMILLAALLLTRST